MRLKIKYSVKRLVSSFHLSLTEKTVCLLNLGGKVSIYICFFRIEMDTNYKAKTITIFTRICSFSILKQTS